MPVTGVLAADFSSFYDAVQKADVQLKDFEGDAAKVERSLSKMTDSFSGQKVISDATLMAEVFERMGGASKFTTQELDRMGTTAAEAINKMKALGQEVPADLQALADATTKTSTATGGLMSKYKEFDDVLELGGVNIREQVKGIEQLGSFAGKTATELGAFATAGAIAGAAMVGWQIGTKIDEWTGLSTSIQKATESLLGWGTATETAGAKQDTINRAIAQGAPATISYTDAIKFNAQAMQDNIAKSVDWNQRLTDARANVAGLSDETVKGIQAAQQMGATQEQLTAKFGITADGLRVLTERTKAQEEADKTAAAEAKAAWENYFNARSNAMKRMHEEEARMMEEATKREADQAAMFENLDIQARIKKQAAYDAQAKAEADAQAKTEAERIAANQREIDAILNVSAAHTAGGQTAQAAAAGTTAAYEGVAQQIEITGEAVREWINLMKYTAEAQAILSSGSGLFTTQSQRERIAALGGGGGGGQQVFNNTFQIVDTESNIAKRVGDTIMKQVKAGTQLGTA